MATIVNPDGIPKLTRGRPWKITGLAGASQLTATEQAVQFTLGFVDLFNQRKLTIHVVGTITTPTGVLEASLDGGATWFVLGNGTDYALTGQLTGDAAAAFAGHYDVSGLGGALFHFGFTAGTFTGNADVWAEID